MSTSPAFLHGWVDSPDYRGTFDVLQSCFLTIWLSTWTCLHLNVPAPNDGAWKQILRKFRWMVIAVFGPEFVAVLAAGQRASAVRVHDTMKELGYSDWTLRHSFYADMGGFMLHPRDSSPFPIDGLQLIYLLQRGYLNLPEITEKEISDKSKANVLAKCLVCLQTGWFITQCFGRLAQNLSLTTLELTTISYVWCTWAIYGNWLKKPLDVGNPTILKIEASSAEILRTAGPAARDPYIRNPLDFIGEEHRSWTLDVQPHFRFRVDPRERPMPRILNDGFPWFTNVHDVTLCLFVILVYSAIHVCGWNLPYPSRTEKILWRISTLIIFCSTLIFFVREIIWSIRRSAQFLHLNQMKISMKSVYYIWTNKIDKVAGANELIVHRRPERGSVTRWHAFVIGPSATLYFLARLYVIVEALVSLRAAPKNWFRTLNWTSFLPHF